MTSMMMTKRTILMMKPIRQRYSYILDPYDMVNSLLYSKQSTGDKDKTKQQKEIDKLIKKQLKRVEEEWAKLSGKKE